MKKTLLLFFLVVSTLACAEETVTIAILAKDKAHCLELYLHCIEGQTWPAEKTYLYIRTNNNNDATKEILQAWVDKVKERYREVYFDDSDVPQKVERFEQHEWNCERYQVLSEIRQNSVDFAREKGAHYFVADCDNFIFPHTIEALVKTGLPVVAPFLKTTSRYSNLHAAIDQNGYYKECPLYEQLITQQIKGLVEVPLVHCTYFIRDEALEFVCYNDKSYRMEYVIFSAALRKNGVPQYFDNREIYGYLTFATNAEELTKEPWLKKIDPTHASAISENAFSTIYEKRGWGINPAGRGSIENNTHLYRAFLQNFMKEQNIKTVVDVGCGDWKIARLMNWDGIDYTGYDIVHSVVERNNERFANAHIRFKHCDAIHQELPEADLLICKDVLQHLPNSDIHCFIKQLNKYKHCIITNGVACPSLISLNGDIEPGDCRSLDLSKPPFNLIMKRSIHFVTSAGDEKVIQHYIP